MTVHLKVNTVIIMALDGFEKILHENNRKCVISTIEIKILRIQEHETTINSLENGKPATDNLIKLREVNELCFILSAFILLLVDLNEESKS